MARNIKQPIPEQIGDINLDNYYLDHQTYNKAVFVHKKFLPKSQFHRKNCDPEVNNNFVKLNTQEISQQFDIGRDLQKEFNEKRKIKSNLHDESVLAQTVKFAKDLAPTIIPPSREFSPTPIVYTIKTSKKSGKKISKCSSPRENELMPDIHKSKDTRHIKKDKIRISKEDVSQSTQDNTSDDIQTNQSSSLSLSEAFENKLNKTRNHRKRKQEIESKMDISNVMEGITTALDNNNNKIKIHVMNEEERNIFYESIRNPIVNSIKEYLNEVKIPSEIAAEMQVISQTLASNMEKLDYAIHKLENIERKITDYSDKKTKVIMSPKTISSKASRLEELAEDMPDVREINAEEEYETAYKKTMVSRSAVVAMSPNEYRTSRMPDNYDHGENGPVQVNVTYSQLESKQERPNRIPARFCWTDGNRNN
ncbi:hypothetical protein RR48_13158 [Papilio machaon]|uniref:Uncharacterized protein n=1 Tax=Papilio machaon TaxID=76193 RepID=A0A194QW39_PAPMA|nr:hypothetical protein RR48_13158 [Papilio machaon]